MVKIVSKEQVMKLMQQNPNLLLLDVRQPEEYEKAHLPGAVLLPLPDLPERLNEID
jgi:rhodanese-related sulfurtransferase